jgi:hypothetical protein
MTPLPSANTSRVGCVEDCHLQVNAPCRAHKQKRRHPSPLFALLARAANALEPANSSANVLIGQCVLPRVDDAAQVNFGTKVTQRPLSLTWSHRPSRSTEFVYGLVNLRDDGVGIHTAALATQPLRQRSGERYSISGLLATEFGRFMNRSNFVYGLFSGW